MEILRWTIFVIIFVFLTAVLRQVSSQTIDRGQCSWLQQDGRTFVCTSLHSRNGVTDPDVCKQQCLTDADLLTCFSIEYSSASQVCQFCTDRFDTNTINTEGSVLSTIYYLDCTDLDECSPNPCLNGGICMDGDNDYTCACPTGYTGKNCQTNIDECGPNPCVNGGTCSDLVNDYICTCVAGYEGKNCQTNIDECHSHPCLNNGTCTDLLNGYSCSCRPDYSGKHCETFIKKPVPVVAIDDSDYVYFLRHHPEYLVMIGFGLLILVLLITVIVTICVLSPKDR